MYIETELYSVIVQGLWRVSRGLRNDVIFDHIFNCGILWYWCLSVFIRLG